MNQNDMDRYRWRTGHRWSGNRDRGRRQNFFRNKKKASLALIIIGACLFLAVLLSLHGCGSIGSDRFDSRQKALEQEKLKEVHGAGGENPDQQFAQALRAADTHTSKESDHLAPPKQKSIENPEKQFAVVLRAYDASAKKPREVKK